MRRFSIATVLLGSVLAQFCLAADATRYAPPEDPYFPKFSYFHNHFGAAPGPMQLQPPVRLQNYVRDGKLVLSLKDYLDLVMANNTDIAVQKVTVETYENAITRAFSVFDPFASASFSTTRTKSPTSSSLNGANTLNTLDQPLNLSLQQTTVTGGAYSVGFNDTKLSTNSAFATYNPSYTQNLNFSFTQPLLRGFGPAITKIPITIARSRLREGAFILKDQVTQLVAAAESAYWDVVEARQNVRVQEQSLKLSDASLKRTQREIELGATSALDVYQPQEQDTQAQLSLAQAQFQLKQTEDALRKQMGADLAPNVRNLPIELTEAPETVTSDLTFNVDDTVGKALNTRFDLNGLRQSVSADTLLIRQAKDRLKPNLSLSVNYGSLGLGGTYYQQESFIDPNGNPATAVSVTPGGPLNALSQLFGFGYPTITVGLNLQLPIRDRNATANLADALEARNADALRVRSTEQTVRLQVLTALNNINRSKVSVELARKVRDLAQKRVDAAQKEYDLGTTTIFFVLAAQSDLTLSESSLVRESINLQRNLLALYQSTGELLSQHGIQLATP